MNLFDLNKRTPLTLKSFFLVLIPPVGPFSTCLFKTHFNSCLLRSKLGLYYVTNVLAILGPRTFVYRLALLPVTLFMAYRATVFLDIAKSFSTSESDKLDYMNQAWVVCWHVLI